jgi:hypothetical protein
MKFIASRPAPKIAVSSASRPIRERSIDCRSAPIWRNTASGKRSSSPSASQPSRLRELRRLAGGTPVFTKLPSAHFICEGIESVGAAWRPVWRCTVCFATSQL